MPTKGKECENNNNSEDSEVAISVVDRDETPETEDGVDLKHMLVTEVYPELSRFEDPYDRWAFEQSRRRHGGDLPITPVTLGWHDVVYQLPPRKLLGVFPVKGAQGRVVLKHVTGMALPGQLMALMGSTGAGKSTLLDILVGIPKTGRVTGTVAMNGRRPQEAKELYGYVSQDDTLPGTQTVWETLMFYAKLKLPFDMPTSEKEQRVNALIAELGLEKCRDSFVGSTMRRGLSGGERKRLAIGCEVVTNPGIILLDEPTTGLDSFSSLSVMMILNDLASKGHTIVCTLHQPRSSIFALIDHLMILSQGRVVYYGPTGNAESYFADIGFTHKPGINPADFASLFLLSHHLHVHLILLCFFFSFSVDVTILQEDAATSVVRERYMRLAGKEVDTKNCKQVNLADVFQERCGAKVEEMVLQACQEKQGEERQQEDHKKSLKERLPPAFTQKYATPWWYQTYLLTIRNTQTAWRDPRLLISQSISTLLLSGIFATFFLNINNPGAALQNRAGLLMWMVMNMAFTTEYVMVHCLYFFLFLTPLSFCVFHMCFDSPISITVIEDRPTMNRERTAGLYRTSSYFLSKIIFDLPFEILWPTILSSIVYFSVGFRSGFGPFVIFTLTLWFVAFDSASLFFAIATLSPNLGVAMALAPLLLILLILGSGFWVLPSQIPGGWIWLYYISFFRFAFQALMVNEFSGTDAAALAAYEISGLSIMENFMCLWAIVIVLRVVSYLFLLVLYRDKR